MKMWLKGHLIVTLNEYVYQNIFVKINPQYFQSYSIDEDTVGDF